MNDLDLEFHGKASNGQKDQSFVNLNLLLRRCYVALKSGGLVEQRQVISEFLDFKVFIDHLFHSFRSGCSTELLQV
jgi:hypothetical protein